jgi:hypothetical protein
LRPSPISKPAVLIASDIGDGGLYQVRVNLIVLNSGELN